MALDAVGAAGGLGILWNPNLVTLSNFLASRNMLLTCSHVLGTSVRGVLTNVYGPFQLAWKLSFLEELRSLKTWVGRDHWIVGRDFNLIRMLEEKKGGIKSLGEVNLTFNEVIYELHLVDVQTPNNFHTWKNKWTSPWHIASKTRQIPSLGISGDRGRWNRCNSNANNRIWSLADMPGLGNVGGVCEATLPLWKILANTPWFPLPFKGPVGSLPRSRGVEDVHSPTKT